MFLKEEQTRKLRPFLNVQRIICFALIAGLLFQIGVFCLMVNWGEANVNLNIFSQLGLGFMALCIVAAFVIPPLASPKPSGELLQNMTGSPNFKEFDFELKEDRQIAQLALQHQTKTIIKFALLEGAGVFNTFIFFVDTNLLNLAAATVLLAIQVLCIPPNHSVFRWIESGLVDVTGTHSAQKHQ